MRLLNASILVALHLCDLVKFWFCLFSSFPCVPQGSLCSLLFIRHFTAWPFWIYYYILWMWGEKDCFSFLRMRRWIQLLLILSDNSIENQWCQVLALVYQCYIAAWLLQSYECNGVWLLFAGCFEAVFMYQQMIWGKIKVCRQYPIYNHI